MEVSCKDQQQKMRATELNRLKGRRTYLSGIWNEKGKTCLPLPMTSVPGGGRLESFELCLESCTLWCMTASVRTVLSGFSQDVMLDFVVFFILPVHVMVILPVVFTPAHSCFSLSDENQGLDCGFLGSLHDNPPIDGVSICESVAAVDGIVFNREMSDCHPPPTKITKGNDLQ